MKAFDVEIPELEVSFTVGAADSLANAAAEAGVEIPVGCKDGKCGSCVVRAVEGEVEHRDEVLTPEARAQGWMCACVSRARGERLVLEL